MFALLRPFMLISVLKPFRGHDLDARQRQGQHIQQRIRASLAMLIGHWVAVLCQRFCHCVKAATGFREYAMNLVSTQIEVSRVNPLRLRLLTVQTAKLGDGGQEGV